MKMLDVVVVRLTGVVPFAAAVRPSQDFNPAFTIRKVHRSSPGPSPLPLTTKRSQKPRRTLFHRTDGQLDSQNRGRHPAHRPSSTDRAALGVDRSIYFRVLGHGLLLRGDGASASSSSSSLDESSSELSSLRASRARRRVGAIRQNSRRVRRGRRRRGAASSSSELSESSSLLESSDDGPAPAAAAPRQQAGRRTRRVVGGGSEESAAGAAPGGLVVHRRSRCRRVGPSALMAAFMTPRRPRC